MAVVALDLSAPSLAYAEIEISRVLPGHAHRLRSFVGDLSCLPDIGEASSQIEISRPPEREERRAEMRATPPARLGAAERGAAGDLDGRDDAYADGGDACADGVDAAHERFLRCIGGRFRSRWNCSVAMGCPSHTPHA